MSKENFEILCSILSTDNYRLVLNVGINFVCIIFIHLIIYKCKKIGEHASLINDLKFEAVCEDISMLNKQLHIFIHASKKSNQRVNNLAFELRKLKLSNAILKFNKADKFRIYYIEKLNRIDADLEEIDEVYLEKTVTEIYQKLHKWYKWH